jgi:hypothetical protein
MSKREDLMRDASNILESMGVGVPSAGTETSSLPTHLRGVDRMRDAKMIPLDLIEPDPGQPRKEFDPEALAKLADSLRKRGQILRAHLSTRAATTPVNAHRSFWSWTA